MNGHVLTDSQITPVREAQMLLRNKEWNKSDLDEYELFWSNSLYSKLLSSSSNASTTMHQQV